MSKAQLADQHVVLGFCNLRAVQEVVAVVVVADELAEALRELRKSTGGRTANQSQHAALQRDIDRLRFVLADIDSVAPVQGEDDELEGRLPALQHSEQLLHAADAAARDLRRAGCAVGLAARRPGWDGTERRAGGAGAGG